MAYGLSPEGGTTFGRRATRPIESPVHEWLTLERSPGASRWGFFLRAETMSPRPRHRSLLDAPRRYLRHVLED